MDLAACFPSLLAGILEEIGPEEIHTLVIWTKNPAPALEDASLAKILAGLESIHLHLTVTGLGGTAVEPGVPPWRETMAAVPETLLLPGLKPGGITLRYDPLMSFSGPLGTTSNLDRDLFSDILASAFELGVRRVRTSILTRYNKSDRRLREAGLEVIEGFAARASIFMEEVMEPLCRSRGMILETCVNPDRGDPGCIDGRRLRELHPRGLACSLVRDRSQRAGCGCTGSRDVGRYLSCPHGCLYCYGNPSGPKPAKGGPS